MLGNCASFPGLGLQRRKKRGDDMVQPWGYQTKHHPAILLRVLNLRRSYTRQGLSRNEHTPTGGAAPFNRPPRRDTKTTSETNPSCPESLA
jgi:hypothetical protein